MTDFAEVIKGAIARSLDGVHTSIPATVKEYLPLLQQAVLEPVIEGMPELYDVPVLWPRGGGYASHMPLAAGDSVLLVFCEQDFSPWRLGGSAMAPAILRRHGLFAYAVPGAAPDTSPLLGVPVRSGAWFGEDNPAGMAVHVTSSGVQLGVTPAATLPVAMAGLVEAIGATLVSALQSACGSVVPVAQDGGAAAFQTFSQALSTALASWPGPVASTVVKSSG